MRQAGGLPDHRFTATAVFAAAGFVAAQALQADGKTLLAVVGQGQGEGTAHLSTQTAGVGVEHQTQLAKTAPAAGGIDGPRQHNHPEEGK